MRKFEAISVLLILGLIVYRIFFGIELQVFLRVMLTLMAIFYMWFGLFLFNRTRPLDLFDKWKRKELSLFQISGSITFGFLYSFSFITIMYAVNFYAAMNTMILLAFLFNVSIIGLCYFSLWQGKVETSFLKQFLVRSWVLASLFAVMMLVPLDQRLNALYKDYPDFIEAYNQYLEYPDHPESLQRLKEERSAFR
ncbi:MAG: hypothetical protein EA361_07700 [Bacteroidetes bacterium]|nr:MAG: hypothetical protein EA361_07700 [Bacteroidota bacterium]